MEHTLQITGPHGQMQSYTVTKHRGSEGMGICRQILALAVEPVLAGLGPVAAAAFATKGAGALDNPAVLAALDFGALSRGIKAALLGLPDALVLSVLRYTNRNGKPLVGPDGRATAAFDEAYAANYDELGVVLWEVCRLNGFFPGLDTFESVARRALAAMPATPAKPA